MKGVSILTFIKVIAVMLLLSLVLLVVYAGKTAPEAEHEHTFKDQWQILEAPTAEKEGKESNVCSECKESVTRPIDKLHTHSYAGNWTVEKSPTKDTSGEESNVCHVCNEKVTRSIAKLNVVSIFVSKQPTVTSYYTGQNFNKSGMVITAILDNGETVDINDYKIITNQPLTSTVKEAKIEYEGFAVSIPITVSPATLAFINSLGYIENGTLVCVEALCVSSITTDNNEKQNIIKDLTTDTFVILKGADYSYKTGDKIKFFATVKANGNEKYLEYSSENEGISSTIVSTENYITLKSQKTEIKKSSDMETAFTEGNTARFTPVEYSGKFYVVNTGSDYIIHFNEDASSIDDLKLTSGKIVRISAKNIDESVLLGRLSFESNPTYPGVLATGSISAFYTYSDSNNIYLDIINTSWINVDLYKDEYQYVSEVAHAFLYQLPYVDYDQYNTRRNINPAPEDATEQQRIYLDCSSYVNAVYYNTFGVNVMPYTIGEKGASTANFTAYAKENPENVDVIGYWETKDYTTEEEQTALLESLYNQLQIGDVIVYRKPSSGHALIYVGGGKILHCMNTESYSHNGTDPSKAYDCVSSASIGFESANNLFQNKSASRYLFKYVNFSIIRPLNRGLTVTEQTKARMTIPSLSIEKLLDANMYSAVFTGDTLTYTVTLKNNGNSDLENVTLTEKVPTGTVFISASEGITHSDGAISWIGKVEKETTVTLTFSVKVTETTPGALIESNEGTVNGLKLNKITNTVSGISLEKLNELKDLGNSYVANGTTYTDPMLMVNAIYNALIGKNILDYSTVSEALNDIINVEGKKYNENCAAKDTVIKNLSGGYLIRGTNPHHNDRIRAVRIEYLTVGDVIIAEHSTNNAGTNKRAVAYIYLGDNDFLSVNTNDGVCSIVKHEKPDVKKIQNILTSLYSYEKYAVIRPSMNNTAE